MAECLVVAGGHRLSGSLQIHGAKNSVLPILAAALLPNGKSVLHNCPALSDVQSAIRILERLGCVVSREGQTVVVDASPVTYCEIDDSLMREMRSSVIFLGAALARCGCACMSFPGGCELGPRPIDLHLTALSQLGATIEEEGGHIFCRAGKMKGAEINLSFPSVGATENIMLAATACQGTTRIINAAREPEIADLQSFLKKCGVKIRGAGGSVIEIEGGPVRSGAEHAVLPDRIEAATYLSACGAGGGDILLTGARPQHLSPVLSILSEAGAAIKAGKDSIRMSASGLSAVPSVRTMPYPGFPTDAQAPLMAAMATAKGTTMFYETIFENRFRHVDELARMGTSIRVAGRVAVVTGVPRLRGASVHATDLRGGAALAVAAAGAEGETRIFGTNHIDRGYERLESAFSSLGIPTRRIDQRE